MLDKNSLNLSWLVKLRWGAIGGQLVAVLLAEPLMGTALLLPSSLLIAAAVVSNIVPALMLKTRRPVSEAMLALFMGIDVLVLSGLLYISGGPFNPFSILYLVNIALAAVILNPRWAWALLGFSVACFGALFLEPIWFPLSENHAQHGSELQWHLKGMWLAFGVAAALIVYFVQHVTRALARRDAELADALSLTAKNEKLAALATLAAGAAHELATPLSTIAVASKELERLLEKQGAPREVSADAALIRRQVERCRNILTQMSANAGQSAGEVWVDCTGMELVSAAVAETEKVQHIEVTSQPDALSSRIYLPKTAVIQAIRSLIKNALQASGEDKRVQVKLSAVGASLQLDVCDEGAGMPREVLARAGDPFFTTKAPGEGMGLGLFLTRTVLERIGGKLSLSSSPGQGTRATVQVPLARREAGAA